MSLGIHRLLSPFAIDFVLAHLDIILMVAVHNERTVWWW